MIRWEHGFALVAGLILLVGGIGFALAGKWGRALLLAGLGVMCLLIVLPGLARSARDPALDEAGAIGDSRSVMSSEEAYRASNGGAYGRLSCLAAPTSCGFPTGTPSFLDPQLAALEPLRGYTRSFVAGARKPGAPDANGIASYAFVVVPTKPGVTGNRAFCGDDTGRTCVTRDGTTPAVKDGRCAEPCTPLQ
jgi:hypothetical protein